MFRAKAAWYIGGLAQIHRMVLLLTAGLSLMISYATINAPIVAGLNKRLTDCTLQIYVLEEINPQAVPNHEVWIEDMQVENISLMQQLFGDEREGFEYRNAQEFGYSNDVVVCTGGPGSKLQVSWPVGQSFQCRFWKQNLSGMIELSLIVGDRQIDYQLVDLFSAEAGEYFIYSAPETKGYIPPYFAVVRIGIIVLLGMIVFLVLSIGMVKLIKSGTNSCE